MPTSTMRNAADPSPRPRTPKCSYYTWSLALAACLLGQPGLGEVWAAELSAPPAEGSQTRDESKEAPKQTPPPALPSDAQPSDDSRNLPQPEVRIIHEKDKTIEEYRVGGVLRYVKITPKYGPPYYLVDRNGDGIPETRYDLQNGPPPINQWILKKW